MSVEVYDSRFLVVSEKHEDDFLKPNQRFLCVRCGHRTRIWSTSCGGCYRTNTYQVVKLDRAGKSIHDSDDPDALVDIDDEGNVLEADPGDDELEEVEQSPKAVFVSQVKFQRHKKIVFGIKGFDDVLGGGAVVGSIIGMTGDPGAGKSTILLHALVKLANSGIPVMQIDAEEPKENIIDRAYRLGLDKAGKKHLAIYDAGGFIEDALDAANRIKPAVVCVNSINEFYARDAAGRPIDTECGNPLQMKRIARLLFRWGHQTKTTTFIVCQVNADGDMTGPKAVAHVMDATFKLTKDEKFDVEGDPGYQRVHFASEKGKNRFGSNATKAAFKWSKDGILIPCKGE